MKRGLFLIPVKCKCGEYVFCEFGHKEQDGGLIEHKGCKLMKKQSKRSKT